MFREDQFSGGVGRDPRFRNLLVKRYSSHCERECGYNHPMGISEIISFKIYDFIKVER